METNEIKPDIPVVKDEDVSFIGSLKMKNRLFSPTNPLWMPKGSIRAIIALGLVMTAIYCTVHNIILNDRIWDLIMGFTSLYMGSRLNFDKQKNDNK